tara:strand:+ start:447 stop:725 length:279 start_codon:yes stop_codon:yes gene_type:complete
MEYKDPNGLDGLERDLAKLGNAVIEWQEAPELIKARARKLSFHNTTNICVESCRDINYFDASYLAGHVLMVSLTVNVLSLIGLVGYVASRLI